MNQKKEEPREKVLMPCRRGSDRLTEGQGCDSKNAYRLRPQGSKFPAFKCCKCGYEWTVPIGGQFVGV